MVSPLNSKESFTYYHGYTRKCEQVSGAPFWSILQTIFISLDSLEVLIRSSIDKPAVCLREWESPGPSEEPLFTRPVRSLLKPRGTCWVTDLSQASGLPLRSPSRASQISFLVMLLCFFGFLDFCLYISVHFYFCNLPFIVFSFFLFLSKALLFPSLNRDPSRKIRGKR